MKHRMMAIVAFFAFVLSFAITSPASAECSIDDQAEFCKDHRCIYTYVTGDMKWDQVKSRIDIAKSFGLRVKVVSYGDPDAFTIALKWFSVAKGWEGRKYIYLTALMGTIPPVNKESYNEYFVPLMYDFNREYTQKILAGGKVDRNQLFGYTRDMLAIYEKLNSDVLSEYEDIPGYYIAEDNGCVFKARKGGNFSHELNSQRGDQIKLLNTMLKNLKDPAYRPSVEEIAKFMKDSLAKANK